MSPVFNGKNPVIVPFALGVALLGLFAAHALHTSREPLIDLRMFRARSFTGASLMMLMFGGSLFGSMFLLPLYEQTARGLSSWFIHPKPKLHASQPSILDFTVTVPESDSFAASGYPT